MGSFPDVSESTVLCYSRHSRDRSSFSSGFNTIGAPSSPVSILSELLLLRSQFYQSSFFSTLNFITVPSLFQYQFYLSPFCSKCHRVQCSTAPYIAVTGVLSPPVSILSQFFLLHCQSYLSPSCSKCQRVRHSAAPHIAETRVLSPLVSILLELLLLWSQFYHSSFFSTLSFI